MYSFWSFQYIPSIHIHSSARRWDVSHRKYSPYEANYLNQFRITILNHKTRNDNRVFAVENVPCLLSANLLLGSSYNIDISFILLGKIRHDIKILRVSMLFSLCLT